MNENKSGEKGVEMRVAVILLFMSRMLFSDPGLQAQPGGNSMGSIIFRDEQGRTLTTEDLRRATGTVNWEIVGENDVPKEAQMLHQRARQAGQRGDHKKALALLQQASKLAPLWPYPVYDTAYEYLLMQDFEGARVNYQKTLELSPRGFFTAITAVDTLTREQKGELPPGTYLAYVSLEWMNDPVKKAAAVHRMVELVPGFAPAWKEYALLVKDHNERLTIIEKGLAAHPDAETKGVLTINKAIIFNLRGDRDGAVRLLGELALDPKSSLGSALSAKAALALIVNR